MAYVIGSQKGKDIADEMRAGETYYASDGSVWKKENDGSVTVNHNGSTYKNAYQSDYSTWGKNQMANDASWQDVQRTLNSRVNKANNTPGLEKYAYDDVYTEMYNYIREKQDEEARAGYDSLTKPDSYSSQYGEDIDELLNKILNRDDFSYNAEDDPLYQQYKEQYQREGDRAMRETLAEAAAGAGGMNTYAVTAASQANNYYNSQLTDKIPELYQLAYEMYLQDKESMVEDLGLLTSMDDTQYSRYRDTMDDYWNDKYYAYNEYQDTITRNDDALEDQRDFIYDDYWTNKEYDDTRADTEYERTESEKDDAYNKVVDMISRGVTTIDSDLIAQAGLTQQQVDQMITEQEQQTTYSSGGGSGGSRRSGSGGDGNNPVVKKNTNDSGFAEISLRCSELATQGDQWGAVALAREAYDNGHITRGEYSVLSQKYNPILNPTNK